MITLSGLPVSHLNTLLNLDTILERNRHAIAVHADKQQTLPFFLPVVETEKGLAWIDDDDGRPGGNQPKKPDSIGSRVSAQKRRLEEGNLAALEPVPGFGIRLVHAKSDADCESLTKLTLVRFTNLFALFPFYFGAHFRRDARCY